MARFKGHHPQLAIVDDHIAVLDAEKPLLYRYQKQDKHWNILATITARTVERKQRTLSVHGNLTHKSLLILDDKTVKAADVEWETQTQTKAQSIITIPAEVQTEGVPSTGDAADDPAIWHNAAQPSQSRIFSDR